MDDTDRLEIELLPKSLDKIDDKDLSNKHKKRKKSINVQGDSNSNFKEIESILLGSHLNNKELLHASNTKEIEPQSNKSYDKKSVGIPNSSQNEAQQQTISNIPQLLNFKPNTASTFNLKNEPALNGATANGKQAGKPIYLEGLSGEAVQQGFDQLNSKSLATNNSFTPCNQNEETDGSSTCKQATELIPHSRTTCCKTTKEVVVKTIPPETTTLRTVAMNIDELQMGTFGLTIVPLDFDKKKHPLSDPEFINFGNLGRYGVVDENNGTIISGQAAIDFLEFSQGRNQSENTDKN